jgi:elongation factor P hydroxylase
MLGEIRQARDRAHKPRHASLGVLRIAATHIFPQCGGVKKLLAEICPDGGPPHLPANGPCSLAVAKPTTGFFSTTKKKKARWLISNELRRELYV